MPHFKVRIMVTDPILLTILFSGSATLLVTFLFGFPPVNKPGKAGATAKNGRCSLVWGPLTHARVSSERLYPRHPEVSGYDLS